VNHETVKLVRSAAGGNRDSYGTLVKNYTGFVYTMALRITGDHHLAEDLCQDIFLKGWLKLNKLREPAAFPGWISAIARRTCLNAVEKRNRKMEVGEVEAVLVNLNPTLPAVYDSSRIILERAVSQLSLRDRQLVTLCYFQELTSVEVQKLWEFPMER
jgi:RNA polymerase sigma factor (sigma-70 family)